MSLPTVSVRRPVFAATMALLIFVLGIAALAGLPVREFPDVERPVVSVTTPARDGSGGGGRALPLCRPATSWASA